MKRTTLYCLMLVISSFLSFAPRIAWAQCPVTVISSSAVLVAGTTDQWDMTLLYTGTGGSVIFSTIKTDPNCGCTPAPSPCLPFDGSGTILWRQKAGAKNDLHYDIYSGSTCSGTPCHSAGLPVTLINFVATRATEDKVKLSWQTAMEINNTGFDVQKSTDGVFFQKIGFVQTQAQNGNSQSLLSYGFEDANSSNTLTYYRLLQLDIDNKETLSEVKLVRGNGEKAVTRIFPNPNHGTVNISFGDQNTKQNVTLIDRIGRTLYQQTAQGSLQINSLSPGFYFLKIVSVDTKEQIVQKLIVQ